MDKYKYYKGNNIKFPLSKKKALYYLKLGCKIVLYDPKIGAYICCEYNNFRNIDYPSYKFDLLTIDDIRYIINNPGSIGFIQDPIGINEQDINDTRNSSKRL